MSLDPRSSSPDSPADALLESPTSPPEGASPHRQAVLSGLFCAGLAVLGLLLTPVGARLDEAWLSLGFRLRPVPSPHPRVSVLVLRGQAGNGDPASVRESLAEALELLAGSSEAPAAQPAAVLVDVLLSEREPEGTCLSGNRSLGERIVAASQRLGRVVHAVALGNDARDYHDAAPDLQGLLPHFLPDVATFEAGRVGQYWQLAHARLNHSLYASAAGVGNLSLQSERVDAHSLFSLPLLSRALLAPPTFLNTTDALPDPARASRGGSSLRADAALIPSLALTGAALLLCPPSRSPYPPAPGWMAGCVVPDTGGLWLAGVFVPLDETGRLAVQYRPQFRLSPETSGQPLPDRGLEVLAFRDGAHGGPALVTPSGQKVRLDALAGRALVVVDARERQTVSTPLGERFPPATAHAQALAALLSHDWLRPISLWIQGLLIAVGLLLTFLLRAQGWGLQAPGRLLTWGGRWLQRPGLVRMRGGLRNALGRMPGDRHVMAGLRAFSASGLLLGLLVVELLLTPEMVLILCWVEVSGLLLWLTPYWLPPTLALAALLMAGVGWRIASGRDVQQALERAQAAYLARQEALELSSARTQRLQDLILKVRADALLPEGDLRALEGLLELAYRQIHDHMPRKSLLPEGFTLLEQLEDARNTLKATLAELASLEEAEALATQEALALQTHQRAWRDGLAALQAAMRILPLGSTRPTPPPAPPPAPRPVLPEPASPSGPRSEPLPPLSDEDLERSHRLGVRTRDPRLLQTLKDVEERFAKHPQVPILIGGETGTGKEMLAQAIHRTLGASAGKFVAQSCGALTESLLQSTFQGHKKGAFTGATTDQDGLFVQAEGGTLFLDEIGELSADGQKQLLRILQERTVKPVGAKTEVPFQCRLVTATLQDLKAKIAQRTFREDLFYRLNGITLTLPPLRERPHDIPLLAAYFLKLDATPGTRPDSLDEGALALLSRYPWPGNVRQLRNVMKRIAIYVDGPTILEIHVQEKLKEEGWNPPKSAAPSSGLPEAPQRWLEDFRAVGFDLTRYQEKTGLKRGRPDAQLRTLFVLMLPNAGWNIIQTVCALTGQTEGERFERVLARLRTFVRTLEGYQLRQEKDGAEAFNEFLRPDYGTYRPAVVKAVEACRSGWILEGLPGNLAVTEAGRTADDSLNDPS